MDQILEKTPIETPRIKSVSQWILALAALCGLALAISGTLRFHRMATCSSWPTAEGEVEISERQRGLLREGSLKYNYRIVYQYTVQETLYRCDRITFAGRNQTPGNGLNLLRVYPKGRRVWVHHHPNNPSLATLDTTWSWAGLKSLMPGLLVAILASIGLWRRWPLQTDYLFKERDPEAPLTWKQIILGTAGMLSCLGIAWIWWELIKMYAGR